MLSCGIVESVMSTDPDPVFHTRPREFVVSDRLTARNKRRIGNPNPHKTRNRLFDPPVLAHVALIPRFIYEYKKNLQA